MATIKRQRVDGNWEYLQMTGEEINALKNDIDVHQSDYVTHQGFGITSGSDNNYSVTLSPSPNAYVDGMCIVIAVHSDSNGVCTLNINGLGSKQLKKTDGTDVVDLKQNGVYTFSFYDGAFLLQSEGMLSHGNEFHTVPFMPISGGDFKGEITVNGKPVGGDGIDNRLEKVTWFVRENGDDSNDGLTEAKAFKTFDKAMNTIKKINFGHREINVGPNVDMSATDGGGHWRFRKICDFFGGKITFKFSETNEFCPYFVNMQCDLEVKDFTRYEEPVVGGSWGSYALFDRCQNVWLENMKTIRTDVQTAYSGVTFQKSHGLVVRPQFIDMQTFCVVADQQSYVRVAEPTGNVITSSSAAFYASCGGIITLFINKVTAPLMKHESEGGLVFLS